mgnify:CR=1 FL=1
MTHPSTAGPAQRARHEDGLPARAEEVVGHGGMELAVGHRAVGTGDEDHVSFRDRIDQNIDDLIFLSFQLCALKFHFTFLFERLSCLLQYIVLQVLNAAYQL